MLIETTRDIDAPASAVWEVLGERFADVAEITDAIEKSALDGELGEGAVRTCDLRALGPIPAGQVTERLTRFDRDDKALTYLVLSGLPGFMRRVENAWTIEPLDGGRCRITSAATFDLAWYMVPMTPVMRRQLGKTLREFIDAIEAAVAPAARAA
jgi:Polyketide cyclase / dehydrase and lipid transport